MRRPPPVVALLTDFGQDDIFAGVMKGVLLAGKQPLLRSKAPGLVVQEVYGLLIGHYLVRREMAKAVVGSPPSPARIPCGVR